MLMNDKYRVFASIDGVIGYSSIVLCGAYEIKSSDDPHQPKYTIDLFVFEEIGVIEKTQYKKYIGTIYCDRFETQETGFYNIEKEQENGIKV